MGLELASLRPLNAAKELVVLVPVAFPHRQSLDKAMRIRAGDRTPQRETHHVGVFLDPALGQGAPDIGQGALAIELTQVGLPVEAVLFISKRSKSVLE